MRATVSERFLSKLKRKIYREAYVANEVRLSLAYQIRALREQRGWSQQELATKMGTTQSAVSRLEDPDYGKVTLQTILDIAAAFDVGFVGRYCSFPEMHFRLRDVTPSALEAASFDIAQFHVPSPIVANIKMVGQSAITASGSEIFAPIQFRNQPQVAHG